MARWTWPQFRDALLHRGPSYNPVPAAAPSFAVVGETPAQQGIETGFTYIWGPFPTHGIAFRFSEFVTREIDPATVMRWDDALSQPSPKILDPVQELLAWREASKGWAQATEDKLAAVAKVRVHTDRSGRGFSWETDLRAALGQDIPQ